MEKIIKIPEGYEARIEGDKVVLEPKESEDEKIRKEMINFISQIKALSECGCRTGWDIREEDAPKCERFLAYLEKQKEQKPKLPKPHKGDDTNPYDMGVSEAQDYAINRGFDIPLNDGEVFVDERYITQTIGNILRWADEHPKEQEPTGWEWPNLSNCIRNCKKCHGKCFYRKEPYEEQKPANNIKPKFKVGDRVNKNDREDEEYCILTITSVNIDEHCYVCNQCSVIDFEEQDLWHIVEQKPAEWDEDEKIRRMIEDTLHEALISEIISETSLIKMIAYLEKRKEQKPAERVEINKSLSDVVIAELGKYNGENYWKAPWAIDSTGLRYPLYFATLGATWQKEQKPVKIHIDLDNASQDYVYDHFCQGADFTPDYIKGLMEDAFVDGANWQKEQKPAEWSEEDKEMIEDIIDLLDTNLAASDFHEIENWLNSLPERLSLQPKQEWHEEDEK